jgi:hypothetical protein
MDPEIGRNSTPQLSNTTTEETSAQASHERSPSDSSDGLGAETAIVRLAEQVSTSQVIDELFSPSSILNTNGSNLSSFSPKTQSPIITNRPQMLQI